MLNIKEFFEKHDEEFLKFERVDHKLSQRKDLHAFILLDSILPNDGYIICFATHDEICLDIDLEALAQNATEEQLIDLHRCGVRYSTEYDCLGMFV